MLLVVALLVFTFISHTPWWGFIAVFFLFLGVFSHIAALYLSKINIMIGRKLENCALILVCLSVLSFIIEFVLFQIW